MDLKQRALLLYEAAQHLGWSDAAEIAEFVSRLERGLPAEDEISVIFHWLGRCRLVHKLDQYPYPPNAWQNYRIPDLLAVFDVEGKTVPVLVEVKVSAENVLSWKPDYLAALQHYADLLGLPLLVAWKHRSFWTLFEARHLQKATTNFNLSFSGALGQTLLGLLAGDFSFSFREGVGAHLKIRKLKDSGTGFDGVIEEAYFLNSRGEKHSGTGGLFQLFGCIDQEQEVQEDANHAVVSFVVQSSEQAEFAHRALVTVLSMLGEANDALVWRQVLLKEQLPQLGASPQQAARNALDAGFLQRVINIMPKTRPAFLGQSDAKGS